MRYSSFSGAAGSWNISAGLESGELTTYGRHGAFQHSMVARASELPYRIAPTVFEEDDRQLYTICVGYSTVRNGETIDVYVGHDEGHTIDHRTWYDGVGYVKMTAEMQAQVGMR